MRYVKMSASAKVPLLHEAELTTHPDDENLQCLKIGKNYYDVEIMLMKFQESDNTWIETDLEDILDQRYLLEIDGKFEEITKSRKKF